MSGIVWAKPAANRKAEGSAGASLPEMTHHIPGWTANSGAQSPPTQCHPLARTLSNRDKPLGCAGPTGQTISKTSRSSSRLLLCLVVQEGQAWTKSIPSE